MSEQTRLIGRREFLQVAAGAASLRRTKAALRERQPNILVIMTDEHNYQVAGCYGNPLARTPHIDEIAAEGITFDQAYCNSPLCVPSRMAFTAGKYIHRTSAWNNNCWLPSPDYPSIARVLNAVGYESFLCGKMHYDQTRRYGFIEIGGNMNRSLKTGRGNRRKADDTTVNWEAARSRFKDFHTGDTSSVLEHDRRVTAGVLEFLARRGRSEKPFFLVAGYLAPHFPLIVPEPYWRHFRDRVPMPVIPEGFVESMPLNYKHLRYGFGLVDVPEQTVKLGRELYYGLTEWVDEEIGKVLAALRKSPFAENTVVIYTTDHGENMGEHTLWWKNCMYEQASHIPLIISWPKRWKGGQRRQGACSMVDLVQTIIEIAGARAPEDWNGTSMVRWMDDSSTPWKDVAVSQYYAHNIASGYAMLRTGQWKYVYHSAPDDHHPAERELYDLNADPMEFRNLARDPAHQQRVEQLHRMLIRELGEDPDETERRCRVELAKGYDRPELKSSRRAATAET